VGVEFGHSSITSNRGALIFYFLSNLSICSTSAHFIPETNPTMASTADKKSALVERLIDAKAASKLSFDEIAAALSITNAQTAQLFTNQAQLSARAAEILQVIVPGISKADLLEMQKVPMRSFDPDMMQVSIVNFNSQLTTLPEIE
jgi:hypothetical protein